MKKNGFTLIELLVVVAIICILSGVLLVAIDPAANGKGGSSDKDKAILACGRNATPQCLDYEMAKLRQNSYD